MVDMVQRLAEQARYDKRYYEREEQDRPRPTHELGALMALAAKAKTDPTAALDFSVACTPQTFLMALAAKRWDDAHPYYSCVHCHDGKDLPHSGYQCQVCGTEGWG